MSMFIETEFSLQKTHDLIASLPDFLVKYSSLVHTKKAEKENAQKYYYLLPLEYTNQFPLNIKKMVDDYSVYIQSSECVLNALFNKIQRIQEMKGPIIEKYNMSKKTGDNAEREELRVSLKKESKTIYHLTMDVEENISQIEEIVAKMNKLKDSVDLKEFLVKNSEKRLFARRSEMSFDIVFMIDGTNSMDPYFSMTKSEIQKIIDKLKWIYEDANFRIGGVVYRDIGDKDRVEVKKFGDILNFIKFISGIDTHGGLDATEDVNIGLKEVLKLDWKSANRILIHIADSPCHGQRFHCFTEKNDRFINGHYEDMPYEEIFEKLIILEINYLFLQVHPSTEKMTKEFKKIHGKFSNSKKSSFFVEKIDSKNYYLFTDTITTSLANIAATNYIELGIINANKEIKIASNQGDIKKILSLKEEINGVLNYSKSSFKSAVLGICRKITSESSQWTDIIKLSTFEYNKSVIEDVELHFNPVPFAKGKFSQVHGCKLKFKATKSEFDCVLKVHQSKSDNNFYIESVLQSVIAHCFALKFNKELEDLKYPKDLRIYYTRPMIFEHKGAYCHVEGYLKGQYKKFSNNLTSLALNIIFNAFSHYSLEKSDEKLMVTDLQGVSNLLTDPVILSSLEIFKNHGDLGYEGIEQFKKLHECNLICQSLKLKKLNGNKASQMKIQESLYFTQCRNYLCNENSAGENICLTCKNLNLSIPEF